MYFGTRRGEYFQRNAFQALLDHSLASIHIEYTQRNNRSDPFAEKHRLIDSVDNTRKTASPYNSLKYVMSFRATSMLTRQSSSASCGRS